MTGYTLPPEPNHEVGTVVLEIYFSFNRFGHSGCEIHDVTLACFVTLQGP